MAFPFKGAAAATSFSSKISLGKLGVDPEDVFEGSDPKPEVLLAFELLDELLAILTNHWKIDSHNSHSIREAILAKIDLNFLHVSK
jgi:hypothetical protein